MPVDLPRASDQPDTEWKVTGRFVLFCVLGFFAVVVGVNAVMMTLAIRTFPGVDAKNGYDVSQNYNREIAAARQQAERGWVSDIRLGRAGEAALLSLALKARDGQPVAGLSVEAQLAHPSDKRKDQRIELKEIAPGLYEARREGLSAGAWDVHLVGSRGGERVYLANTRAILG